MGERAVVGDLRVERERREGNEANDEHGRVVWGLLRTTSRVRIRGVERRVCVSVCLCACLDRERERGGRLHGTASMRGCVRYVVSCVESERRVTGVGAGARETTRSRNVGGGLNGT